MTIYESKGTKGWVAFTLAGIVLGCFIGLFLLSNIPEGLLFEFLLGMGILGGAVGIGLGYLLSRKTSMEDTYEEPFRSKDLDSFYRSEKDPKLEENLMNAIPEFSDKELIQALTISLQ